MSLPHPLPSWLRRGVEDIGHQYLFYPEREHLGSPADLGLAYEDVCFAARDGVRLHGWFIPARADAELAHVTLLWLHGNAGNISHRLENLELLHQRLGLAQFIIDYRGYGASDGVMSEAGSYLDGHGAVDWLLGRDGVSLERLVCFGRSLGGAVAAALALEHRFAGLILESTFTNIRDVVRRLLPFLPLDALSLQYDTLAKLPRLHLPLLILHGDRDELLPHAMGRRLFAAANEPKRFSTLSGAGHNDTYLSGDAYYETLRSFIAACTRAG
ncbi:MAG: alpha/beta hydrolase [Candidatus Tectomicrobia bacterium]|nr:alpha/beta hydrolase [Candidatus Tectomicrobia bacterium]